MHKSQQIFPWPQNFLCGEIFHFLSVYLFPCNLVVRLQQFVVPWVSIGVAWLYNSICLLPLILCSLCFRSTNFRIGTSGISGWLTVGAAPWNGVEKLLSGLFFLVSGASTSSININISNYINNTNENNNKIHININKKINNANCTNININTNNNYWRNFWVYSLSSKPFLSERVRLCTGNYKWYLFSKHLSKVFVFQACKKSWELWEQKYHVEQEVQIYGTLPNTVYGTRHGMCVFLVVFLWNFSGLVSNVGHKVEKLSLKWINDALISAQVCSPESTLGPVLFSFP